MKIQKHFMLKNSCFEYLEHFEYFKHFEEFFAILGYFVAIFGLFQLINNNLDFFCSNSPLTTTTKSCNRILHLTCTEQNVINNFVFHVLLLIRILCHGKRLNCSV